MEDAPPVTDTAPPARAGDADSREELGAPVAGPAPPRRGHVLAAAAVIVIATLATFFPVVRHDFVDWDDWATVKTNPRLNPPTLSGLAHYWRQFNPHEEFYVPINYTAWWLLAHVARGQDVAGNWVLSPAPYHAFNLAVHALNGVLVLLILRRLTDWLPAALLGALVFALHPVQVEPVAWVSSMYTGLSGSFCLLATWQFLKFTEARDAGARSDVEPEADTGRRAAWPHYLLATLAFVAAGFTKPSVVTVPLVVGLVEWGVRRRRPRDLVLPLGLWLVLASPTILLARASQADAPVYPVAAHLRPIVALDSLSFYLRKLVLPINLGPDYGRSPHWLLTGLRDQLHVTWVLPALLLIGCLIAWRRTRRPLACFLVFTVALLPSLGLVPFDYQRFSTVADRYLYLAMLAPAVAVAIGLSRTRNPGVAAFVGCVVVVLAVLSHRQTYHWKNTNTLFLRALEVNPRSLAAHSVLGYRYAAAGNDERALEEYGMALEANPGDPRVLFNLGNLLLRRGQFADAEAAYRQALPRMPRYSTLRSNLGVALAQMGRREEALASLREAVRLDPNSADAHANLAVVLMAAEDWARARRHFEEALRLSPNSAVARRGLARLDAAGR